MRIANFAGAKSRAQHSAPGPGVSDSQRGERQRRKPACQQLVTTVTHPRYYVALNVPSQSVLIDEAPRACLCLQVLVLGWLPGPCQGGRQDRRLRQRRERQSREGARGQAGGRRRHGPLQRRRLRGLRCRGPAPRRGGALLLLAVRPALRLPPLYRVSKTVTPDQ